MDIIKEISKSRGYLIGSVLCSTAVIIYLSKRFYFDGGRCKSKRRLDGKTAIVTGSNTGIGKETALDFAKRGARVILACRDSRRANEAADEIRAKSGNGNVVVELVDLSSLDSVRKFAARINNNEERVDILVNNAAMFCCPKWKTNDGFEMQFGVNHLGHFLLTNLLVDKMKLSAPSRIVNVSALAYEMGIKSGALHIDDINSEKSYDPWTAYEQTKICNILFTLALSRRLEGSKVTVNALHPGLIRTEIGRYYKEAYGWSEFVYRVVKVFIWPFENWFLKSPLQGAQTQIFCSVDESLEGVSGKYFSDCYERPLLKEVLDERLQERLWEMSEEFVKQKFHF